MIGAIVLNGEKFDGEILGDIVVAVDGGYNKTSRCDVFVGDKDSVIGSVHSVEQIPLCVDKDFTDGECAVDYLIEKQVDKICFYGVLGGRFDHILFNLNLLAKCVLNGIETVAFCNDCDIYVVSSELTVENVLGKTISLALFSDNAHIIYLEGVKWQIKDEVLSKMQTKTISNVAISNKIQLKVESGVVFLIVNK